LEAVWDHLAPVSSPASRAPGTVYLVGAGPGDPGLLTIRARDLLARCHAVVYDALANPAILALPTEDNRPKPERHDVGKRGGRADATRQAEINDLLVRLARQGKQVVRLKGGDPFVFGRGSEEAQALAAADVPFEVVPGVTAGIAAPAYAGIPVTHRGLAASVTLVTGSEDPEKEAATVDWSALARAGGTLVLYMGVKTLPRVAAALVSGGMSGDTPAAAIQWGTYPRQRTIVATLSTLAECAADAGITAPVITVIGAVVALRDEIAWFERRPLHRRRIVVTRAEAEGSELAMRLRERGADVLELPTTRIELLDGAPLREALQRLREYQWVLFTSKNAVWIVWDALRALGRDARAFAGVRLGAVGPATAAALLDHGLAVDVVPTRYVAEGMLEALTRRDDVRGSRILYAAAEGAREALAQGLRTAGARVDVVPIYRSVPDGTSAEELRRALEEGSIDLVTFTSAAAVHAYVAAVGSAALRAPAASIGPVTTAAARVAGIEVEIEAGASTILELVEAVVRWVNLKTSGV
jgi:uroporphyrinogen III methyltransferase / synthase